MKTDMNKKVRIFGEDYTMHDTMRNLRRYGVLKDNNICNNKAESGK